MPREIATSCSERMMRRRLPSSCELATNAIKYGALSNGEGRVAVTFEVKIDGHLDQQPLLILRWEENGGPATAPPADRGFGLTLLERLTRRNEQAEPVFEWRAAGLYCCFSLRIMPVGPLAAQASVSGASPLR